MAVATHVTGISFQVQGKSQMKEQSTGRVKEEIKFINYLMYNNM